MKLFKLTADTEFMAKDIDDAMLKLAEHFKKLVNGKDSNLLIGGIITIETIKNSIRT